MSDAEILAEINADFEESYTTEYTAEEVKSFYEAELSKDWILLSERLTQFCKTDREVLGTAIKLVIAGKMKELKTHVNLKTA